MIVGDAAPAVAVVPTVPVVEKVLLVTARVPSL